MDEVIEFHPPQYNKLGRKTDLAIILLNWNGNGDTVECLHSIEKYALTGLNVLVILVDNASNPPLELDVIRAIIPDILYIKNPKNDGFAEGNNVGIKVCMKYKPSYLLLLNNDTVIVDDTIQRMYCFLQKNIEFGIAGAVNYYYSEPETVWQAGLINNFKSGTQKQIIEFDKRSSAPIEVDYVPGSSLMIRSELMNASGLLDSRYFAYYEENDLCLTVKKQGLKVAFLPNTRILHKVGRSADSVAKFYLKNRNRLVFYKKYSPTLYFVSILIKESVKNFIKAAMLSIQNKNILFMRSYYYALRDYFTGRYSSGSMHKLLSKASN